ncbi:hypothetical protein BKA83DRAFT_4120722 [Pisolithus microcarpus]|nr:hypothetical protein BKA83DRAFT_4120722 [Pisolithus microcarpus]
MHSLLKDAYQDCSNGKDVTGQILHVDHHWLAIKLIQAHIDAENECADHVTDDDGGIQDDEEVLDGNTKLGAPQQPMSQKKLYPFLWCHITNYIECLIFSVQIMVWEYHYLKIKYMSMVDWEVATDHLRYNLMFHGWQQYDCALIQFLETKTAFVQLIFLFACKVVALDDTFHLALVQPLTAGTGVHSHHGEFLIIEHINGDMFLWMKEWTWTRHQTAATAEYLPSSDSDQMSTEMQSDGSELEQQETDLGGLASK